MNSSTTCSACAAFTTTLQLAAASAAECVCATGYVPEVEDNPSLGCTEPSVLPPPPPPPVIGAIYATSVDVAAPVLPPAVYGDPSFGAPRLTVRRRRADISNSLLENVDLQNGSDAGVAPLRAYEYVATLTSLKGEVLSKAVAVRAPAPECDTNTCPAGTTGSQPDSCVACPAGRYSALCGADTCEACPPGTAYATPAPPLDLALLPEERLPCVAGSAAVVAGADYSAFGPARAQAARAVEPVSTSQRIILAAACGLVAVAFFLAAYAAYKTLGHRPGVAARLKRIDNIAFGPHNLAVSRSPGIGASDDAVKAKTHPRRGAFTLVIHATSVVIVAYLVAEFALFNELETRTVVPVGEAGDMTSAASQAPVSLTLSVMLMGTNIRCTADDNATVSVSGSPPAPMVCSADSGGNANVIFTYSASAPRAVLSARSGSVGYFAVTVAPSSPRPVYAAAVRFDVTAPSWKPGASSAASGLVVADEGSVLTGARAATVGVNFVPAQYLSNLNGFELTLESETVEEPRGPAAPVQTVIGARAFVRWTPFVLRVEVISRISLSALLASIASLTAAATSIIVWWSSRYDKRDAEKGSVGHSSSASVFSASGAPPRVPLEGGTELGSRRA